MKLKGETISFRVGDRESKGYLSLPDDGVANPALIIVHEWWGLNDHIKDIADRFARKGYVALAPDIYEGKVTTDPEQAAQFMQGLDQSRAIETLNGAVAFLQSHNRVLGESIGVTGFCMGGSFALLLPCINKNIKASAPFYGDILPDETLKNLSAPLLFIGAENDFWITLDKIDRLKEGLKRFGKDGKVRVYPGVGHAFFNDTRPDAYDKESAEDAWRRVTEFFDQRLKSEN